MGHPSRVIATCAGTRCAGGASLLLDIYCHIAKYATCGGCEVIPGVAQFTYCQDCGGKWCDACTPHVDMCTGSEHSSIVENDGCFKSMCLTCQHKDGAYFTSCDSCDGAWCNRCLPDSIVRCTGEDRPGGTNTVRDPGPGLEGCARVFCAECAWNEDAPCCILCQVCGGTLCIVCMPVKDSGRITCPKCPAIAIATQALCRAAL